MFKYVILQAKSILLAFQNALWQMIFLDKKWSENWGSMAKLTKSGRMQESNLALILTKSLNLTTQQQLIFCLI